MRLLESSVWAAAAVATAAACSFSAGTRVSLDKDAVAKEISANLEGKVGATVRCTLSDSGDTYGVTVTVTKVEGADVKFDVAVDDEPQ